MTRQALRSALATAFFALLAACGGSVGPSPVVVDPLVITVQPAVATIYPGVATTLIITGGTGSYVVTSDNQAAVPLASLAVGHTLTVVANPVIADTLVTLSVRDTGTAPQKTAALTVKPGTVQNLITVTPASNSCMPAGSVGVAVCTGEEAIVSTTIAQAGIPLAARGVRFDVISGDVRFITTPVGTTPEQLSLTTLTVSDQAGVARARMRVLPNVPNQSALIQITDVESGAFQRVAVNVVQFTGTGNASFFALPNEIIFHGPFDNQCASNPSTDIAIFGGTPPYNIVATGGGLFVSPSVVTASGGRFNVSGQGSGCFTDIPVGITDSAGRTITVRLSNVFGTLTVAPVTLVPATFALSCGGSVSFSVGGGTLPFTPSSSHPRVSVSVSGRTVTATRLSPDPATPASYPTSGSIGVTDGATTATSTSAAGIPAFCPP